MWTEITRQKYERGGQRYASDLTDTEWALIERHMPAAKPLGRPRETELRAVLGRFDEILAEDFRCSNPDGSIVDRQGFLKQTALTVTISGLEALDVDVRIMGDFAIIHARTAYTRPDGQRGAGRYTDVWARRGGRWLAVSAHVTRC